ncbi:type II secretion system protein N [Sphingomonas endophytica]|uniref:Type II secretory protein PulC n=1 Tax=Sphingomonas endophytica TaxID=869719 RepID=A0A147I523_9SPHN|nr:type II secretion system protein N [Sphingomonas endophytica]KTT73621.1 type II secretory protein PulC [Sphingomonas endophytica]
MRLKFDARARAILRRLPVVNIYSAAELVLIAGLAVQCARLAWVVLTPISPLGAWVPAGPTVPADAAGVLAGFDPFYRVSGQVQAQGPAVVTSLQLTLFGTRMDSAQARGAAIIAGPDGVQKSVAVGEEVAPGVILRSVAFDHVTLERGGQTEDLYLNQSGAPTGGAPAPDADAAVNPPPPSPPPGAGPPQVSPGGAPPAAGGGGTVSPEQLRSEISAIPRIEGGKISGLTVRGQGGNAFRAAGLRDGDVITSVAGRTIASASDLDQLTRGRAAGGSLSLTVERGGQPLPLTIPVTR